MGTLKKYNVEVRTAQTLIFPSDERDERNLGVYQIYGLKDRETGEIFDGMFRTDLGEDFEISVLPKIGDYLNILSDGSETTVNIGIQVYDKQLKRTLICRDISAFQGNGSRYNTSY